MTRKKIIISTTLFLGFATLFIGTTKIVLSNQSLGRTTNESGTQGQFFRQLAQRWNVPVITDEELEKAVSQSKGLQPIDLALGALFPANPAIRSSYLSKLRTKYPFSEFTALFDLAEEQPKDILTLIAYFTQLPDHAGIKLAYIDALWDKGDKEEAIRILEQKFDVTTPKLGRQILEAMKKIYEQLGKKSADAELIAGAIAEI